MKLTPQNIDAMIDEAIKRTRNELPAWKREHLVGSITGKFVYERGGKQYVIVSYTYFNGCQDVRQDRYFDDA